jgi:hypothetical protein
VTDNETKKFTFFNDKKEQEFTGEIQGKVKKVILDPDNFILKKIKKSSF